MPVAPPRDRWLAREGDPGGLRDTVPMATPPRERRCCEARGLGRRERAFRRVGGVSWREFWNDVMTWREFHRLVVTTWREFRNDVMTWREFHRLVVTTWREYPINAAMTWREIGDAIWRETAFRFLLRGKKRRNTAWNVRRNARPIPARRSHAREECRAGATTYIARSELIGCERDWE